MYYVIYEDQSGRRVSNSKNSLEECYEWIKEAKKIDVAHGFHYYYFPVMEVE